MTRAERMARAIAQFASAIFGEGAPTLTPRQVRDVLSTLPLLDATVITLRFGLAYDGMTAGLDKIAEALGLEGRDQARRVEVHALSLLRHPSRQPIMTGGGSGPLIPFEVVADDEH